MRLSYKFSNLLGCVYREGNIVFTPDGNRLISPVGNRISVFDLKGNKSVTLAVEARMNITTLALSPNGSLLIAVNEDRKRSEELERMIGLQQDIVTLVGQSRLRWYGHVMRREDDNGQCCAALLKKGEALLISLASQAVIHTYHFHRKIHSIKFSPDGKKFVVAKGSDVLMYHTPGLHTAEFNPFVIDRVFYGAHDDTTCLDWTTDSKAFLVGGLDMNTRVYGAEKFENLIVYSVSGHRDAVIGCFFDYNSLDFYTVSRDAQLCVYECSAELSELKPASQPPVTQTNEEKEGSDSDDLETNNREAANTEYVAVSAAKRRKVIQADEEKQKQEGKIVYRRANKHNLREGRGYVKITAAEFHKQSHILITGYDDGVFYLHEMPSFSLIHSLSISDQSITSVSVNPTGDWIAFGCSGLGQLVVWEWQSETYQLKQQGHFSAMSCLAYSPDGQHIVTGGEDAKVKLWDTQSGFCTVTFGGSDSAGRPVGHTSAVTAVTFTQNGHAILSASLDGTVRAFDLKRYKNFRTMTAPESRSTQFASLAVNLSGDIVAAGAQDSFEIFIWLLKDGHLLNILEGHEGPVGSLAFSPTHGTLASGSWDHTVRLWDVYTGGRASREVIQLSCDALAVTYRPDGQEIAVATLDGHISCWDVTVCSQTCSIENTQHDLGYSREDGDKITAKKSAQSKCFTTLCYTADGKCLLAAGRSKFICIYSLEERLLLKKFEVTHNLSLDGIQEFLDKRRMTEFGSLSLMNTDSDTDGSLALPGVRKGDLSSRAYRPRVAVSHVRFSPTGQSFAATTTEGLLIYSLDHGVVFDPFDLDIDITPAAVRQKLSEGSYQVAIMMSFRLNEKPLIHQVIESIPCSHVDYLSRNLPDVYVDKLLMYVAERLETSGHVEFYMSWAERLLVCQGPRLKQRSLTVSPVLRALQKSMSRIHEQLAKLCDHNKYALDYVLALGETKKKEQENENGEEGEEEEEEGSNSSNESEESMDDETHVMKGKSKLQDDDDDDNVEDSDNDDVDDDEEEDDDDYDSDNDDDDDDDDGDMDVDNEQNDDSESDVSDSD